MKKIIYFFSCLSLLLFSTIQGEETFGYILPSTINIGDDFQAIAAKRFLPENAIPIDREFISEFSHDSKVKVVVSGWFMHQKGGFWDHPLPPPEKSWPPSPYVDPLFISIHLTGAFHSTVFSNENIEYLRAHSPIGARDLYTLNELQKRGIPSYFSGCLTITLENKCKKRNNVIYLVDIDDETVDYIKSKVKSPVVVLTQGKPLLQLLSREHRLKYAEHILDLYRQAKFVVTTRLHVAMPCLAFETPVLMLSSVDSHNMTSEPRFKGLLEYLWHCSRKELRNGEFDYFLDNPPENPKSYLSMRENLIKIMTDWVQKNSH